MGAGRFTEEEIHPLGVLRIETESSIWLVTAERYQRLPRDEQPRPATHSVDGRLADGAWHGFRRCWGRIHHDGERQLRLLPDVGPADGVGVVTGVVLAVGGEWVPAADADSRGAAAPYRYLSRMRRVFCP
jgi:hypothetical protein